PGSRDRACPRRYPCASRKTRLVLGPQLLVIRHGQTEWSVAGRRTGRTDVALTDVGRAEAVDAGRTLDGWHLTRAFTSPLQRARTTAELVACPVPLTVDADLVEWDYGEWEGVTT